MTKSNGFHELEIYRLAVAFAVDVYKLTAQFPKEERYGLTDQLRRAAASIGANIAEGYGRYSKKELAHFTYIARGSLMETIHFLFLAKELKYTTESSYSDFEAMSRTLGIKINNFINAIKNQ